MSEEAIFEYLDALRESGDTNMFGAAPYLIRDLGLGRKQAKDNVIKWMETFTARHPSE